MIKQPRPNNNLQRMNKDQLTQKQTKSGDVQRQKTPNSEFYLKEIINSKKRREISNVAPPSKENN